METAKPFYVERTKIIQQNIDLVKGQLNKISWVRFVLILLIIIVSCRGVVTHYESWMAVLSIISFATFLFFVAKSTKLKLQKKYQETLLQININELAGLDGDYSAFESGSEFIDGTHSYSTDLDMFGEFSLYRSLNRCTSGQGKNRLVQRLLYRNTLSDIQDWQSATKVLSEQNSWRQDFQVSGSLAPISTDFEKQFEAWQKAKNHFAHPIWDLVAWLFMLGSVSAIYCYLDNLISGAVFGCFFVVCLIVSRIISSKNDLTYKALGSIAPALVTLSAQLENIENLETKGNLYLQQWKDLVVDSTSSVPASQKIKKLNSILEGFDVRNNMLAFFILNTFLLWDLHMALRLQKWKKQNDTQTLSWLKAVAELEFVNSLATFTFNHQEWVFPEVNNNFFELNANDLGHPLLQQKGRVNNSIKTDGQGRVLLITGSNMGGKSTFLRTIGLNMVLAYVGAPVCASSMTVSMSDMMTSMRIADNLAESTSTFYAELKKLKSIIDAMNTDKQVFALLDEILRGTNTLDRHAGSKALILQIIKHQAVAVVATHDVELSLLEQKYPNGLANYHFDVQVDANDQLYFDYKLKPGVCQRMNANILMRQIGIEMN